MVYKRLHKSVGSMPFQCLPQQLKNEQPDLGSCSHILRCDDQFIVQALLNNATYRRKLIETPFGLLIQMPVPPSGSLLLKMY